MSFPVIHNFDHYYKDTLEFLLVPRNRDGSLFDLTDFEATANIASDRRGPDNPTAAPDLTPQKAEIRNGKVAVAFDTINLDQPEDWTTPWVYDVQIKTKVGVSPPRTHTLITGNLSVMGDVSP
jgi:hypothetical protein